MHGGMTARTRLASSGYRTEADFRAWVSFLTCKPYLEEYYADVACCSPCPLHTPKLRGSEIFTGWWMNQPLYSFGVTDLILQDTTGLGWMRRASSDPMAVAKRASRMQDTAR